MLIAVVVVTVITKLVTAMPEETFVASGGNALPPEVSMAFHLSLHT